MNKITTVALAGVLLVLAGCNRAERDWKSTKAENSASGYARYVAKYPEAKHAVDARRCLDDHAWNDARKANSIESLQSYLNAHAQGAHVVDAQKLLTSLQEDARDWQAAKKANTLGAWQAYLTKHREGRFVPEATALSEEAEWSMASQSEDVAMLTAFSRDYPSSSRTPEAIARADAIRETLVVNAVLGDAAKRLCGSAIKTLSKAWASQISGTLCGTKEHPFRVAITPPDAAGMSLAKDKVEPGVYGSLTPGGTFETSSISSMPEGMYVRMDDAEGLQRLARQSKTVLTAGRLEFRGSVKSAENVVVFQSGMVLTEDSADKAYCSNGTTALLDGVLYTFYGRTWTKTTSQEQKKKNN